MLRTTPHTDIFTQLCVALVCTCMCACVHVWVCMHVCVCMSVHACMHVYVSVCAYLYAYVCVCAPWQEHVHIRDCRGGRTASEPVMLYMIIYTVSVSICYFVSFLRQSQWPVPFVHRKNVFRWTLPYQEKDGEKRARTAGRDVHWLGVRNINTRNRAFPHRTK